MNSSNDSTQKAYETRLEELPVTFSDIKDAAARIAGQAVATPLLEFHCLNTRLEGRVLVKPETLQRTGSFKFRGALNAISRLDPSERQQGVIAFSSGNHAQAVAAAAQLFGIPATIVMPEDAPALKIENTRNYGAEVVLYDRFGQSREEIAEKIRKDSGAALIRPYDDPRVIAGQGTCGLELAQQARQAGASLEQTLISCSGGGLIAGCGIALKTLYPEGRVYAVEPENFDDTARSLKSGKREINLKDAPRSICDALLVETPGELTFSINRHLLSGSLKVSDSEVREAITFAFRELKLVLEPGGAVPLAALLSGKLPAKGRTTAIVLTGANVDPLVFSEILRGRAE